MTNDQSWMCVGMATAALLVGGVIGGTVVWFKTLRQIDRALGHAFK